MTERTDRAEAPEAEWNDWRWQVRNRLRSPVDLVRALELPPETPSVDERLLGRFPFSVTPYYASLIEPRDPGDPILRQVLPVPEEGEADADESPDPFDEEELSPVPGVVHRYPDRALIVPTDFCATLCRHCFRKRTWEHGFSMLDGEALRRAVEYVRGTPGIRDVLVTGGDPLHLQERLLEQLLRELRTIPHLEVLRVASRVPATLPQRLDDELVGLLAAVRPLWFVTQFNHAREVSATAAAALRRLIDAGVTVQNQAVLLRGVNDSCEAQLRLSRALLTVGVRPYYLHLPDPVAGAGHFRIPVDRGRDIVRGMYGRIAGFGIPRLVLDLPGGRGKVPLLHAFERGREGATVRFESPIDGEIVQYRDVPSSGSGGGA